MRFSEACLERLSLAQEYIILYFLSSRSPKLLSIEFGWLELKKYNLRKNYFFSGKIAFKTKEIDWENTQHSVIVPISLYSTFHQGVTGALKMNAFLSVIKENIRGKISLLMTEKAHLKVNSLQFNKSEEATFQQCLKDAHALTERFKECFQGCHVHFWYDYINTDKDYQNFYNQVKELYHLDMNFRKLFDEDIESMYKIDYGNKDRFIQRAREDLFEQSACLLVIKKKGYRYQFYPGPQYRSIEYLNDFEKTLSLIHVFLTIEKKSL